MAIQVIRCNWIGHELDVLAGEASLGVVGDVISRAAMAELLTIDQILAAASDERSAILNEAQTRAANIIATAEQMASDILKDARAKYDAAEVRGYAKGYKHGHAEWMRRLAEFASNQASMHRRMRMRLAEIVSMAVEKIVRVSDIQSLFERVLDKIDQIIDGATYLHISVHPNDFERASATFARLATRWENLGRPLTMLVMVDKRLLPGSCVCESDCGTIDASLETQLCAMRGAVARSLKQSPGFIDGADMEIGELSII